jgi:hypothetical protein
MSKYHPPRRTRVCCTRPSEPLQFITLPDGSLETVCPPGPLGGVLKSYKNVADPDDVHWIEVFPKDTGENAVPMEEELCLKHAAMVVRVSPNTLYKYGARLRSFVKVHNFNYFIVRVLRNHDVPYLEGFGELRKAMDAELEARKESGEIVRPGPHAEGCEGDHRGLCESSRTKERERTKVTNTILNSLGKKPRKR